MSELPLVTEPSDESVRGGSGVMFDRIAGRYDLLNRLMSVGLDRHWRRRLVRALRIPDGGRVLDVATGTADVAILIAHQHPHSPVVGLDPSQGMLAVGRAKLAKYELAERVRLEPGDAQSLPYPDDHFAASCIAFGIRNVPDRLRGLREMARVTRPGGRVAVLELGEPRQGLLAPLVRWQIRWLVPRLGAWLSGAPEYRYLQRSIAAFPPPAAFAALMDEAGLDDVERKRLAFGAANLFTGVVRGAPS